MGLDLKPLMGQVPVRLGRASTESFVGSAHWNSLFMAEDTWS